MPPNVPTKIYLQKVYFQKAYECLLCFLLSVTVFLASQVSCRVDEMRLPAPADAASPCVSAATARTNAGTAATRRPATTAPASPAGRRASA